MNFGWTLSFWLISSCCWFWWKHFERCCSDESEPPDSLCICLHHIHINVVMRQEKSLFDGTHPNNRNIKGRMSVGLFWSCCWTFLSECAFVVSVCRHTHTGSVCWHHELANRESQQTVWPCQYILINMFDRSQLVMLSHDPVRSLLCCSFHCFL